MLTRSVAAIMFYVGDRKLGVGVVIVYSRGNIRDRKFCLNDSFCQVDRD